MNTIGQGPQRPRTAPLEAPALCEICGHAPPAQLLTFLVEDETGALATPAASHERWACASCVATAEGRREP